MQTARRPLGACLGAPAADDAVRWMATARE
jgi:hypothetical protein